MEMRVPVGQRAMGLDRGDDADKAPPRRSQGPKTPSGPRIQARGHAPPTLDQLLRVMEIDRRCGELGFGLVDALVVALAHAIGLRRIATRDVRHFGGVRMRDAGRFELVVHPTNPIAPDRSPVSPVALPERSAAGTGPLAYRCSIPLR